MQAQLPDYPAVADVLEKLDTEIRPSEIHATACGLLCANGAASARTWLHNLWPDRWPAASAEPSGEPAPTDLLLAEAGKLFDELHHSTRQQLNTPDCEFELLLPDDDEAIAQRVDALGDWCQGFLVGLTLGGISDLSALPADAREIAEDMVQIARAGTSYDMTGNDEDEQAYAELVEYLRVGVLLINEELQPTRAAPLIGDGDNPTLH